MSSTFVLASYFPSPLVTDIPSSRYDSKGRQLSFVESEVQRLERMALANASKSRNSSPTQSNRNDSLSNDLSSVLNDQLQIPDSTFKSCLVPAARKSSSTSSSLQPDYRHKPHSLSSIREED